jgi:hypothetical protein
MRHRAAFTATPKFNKGLVAYYPFNGNANDATGNGNNGTVVGSALTNDRHGNAASAYSFDGISNHISLNNKIGNFGKADFTLSSWALKLDQTEGPVIGKRNSEGRGTMLILYSHPGYEISSEWKSVNSGSKSTIQNSSATRYETTDRWFHVLLRRSGNNLDLYFNGELIDSDVTPKINNINNPAVTEIGARYKRGAICAFWRGKIDDVRIYNRALSEAEVKALYALEKAR